MASIADIVQSVRREEEGTANSDSEDDDVSHPPPVPTSTEARSAASVLLSYFQAKCKDEAYIDVLSKVDTLVEKCAKADRRQTTMLNFFKPK